MAQKVNIIIHIIFGVIGIIIGVFPFVTKKGGKKHKFYGRLFILIISVVILTAFIGVIFFRDRPLLTIITLLSSYTTYSGFRVLKTKSKGFSKRDFFVMLLVLSLAITYVFKLNYGNIVWHKSLVYGFSSYIILLTVFDIIRFLFPSLIKYPKFWIYEHVYKMTASFNALISAGAGTVFEDYVPYNQILPAIFCSALLIFNVIYFPRRFLTKKRK